MTLTPESEGGRGWSAWTLMSGVVHTEPRGWLGSSSAVVSLPTRKACTCCPLVDVEIVPAMGRSPQVKEPGGKEGRVTDPNGTRDREGEMDRQTDGHRQRHRRDREIGARGARVS